MAQTVATLPCRPSRPLRSIRYPLGPLEHQLGVYVFPVAPRHVATPPVVMALSARSVLEQVTACACVALRTPADAAAGRANRKAPISAPAIASFTPFLIGFADDRSYIHPGWVNLRNPSADHRH